VGLRKVALQQRCAGIVWLQEKNLKQRLRVNNKEGVSFKLKLKIDVLTLSTPINSFLQSV